jgi:N-acetylglucosaminyl-diphospho-decaprenol L-rhamnosyltransferase
MDAYNTTLLLNPFHAANVGAVVPVIFSPAGHIENSVRRFPSVPRLIKRTLFGKRALDYAWEKALLEVDWSAGMFVDYRGAAFKAIEGFDPRYFKYVEGADICLRLKRAGWRTVLQPTCSVVHDARRASHRSFRHLSWNVSSAFRFLFLPT